jgi:hypothetical protein
MRRVGIATLAVAALLTVVSLLPVTEATDGIRMAILLPGLLASALFWPQGAHTGAGSSAIGVWLMFGTMYVAAGVFWAFIVWSLWAIVAKLRRHRVSVQVSRED